MNPFKCLILILIVSFFSCTKETTSEPQDVPAKVGVEIVDLVCYPYDSISLTFQIVPLDSGKEYSYRWINPDTLMGTGPFTLNIKADVLLDLEVMNSKKTITNFHYEIRKDTIDSLKYDYRNSVIGNYSCDVTTTSFYPAADGTWKSKYNYYKDSVKVSKGNYFRLLKISRLENEMRYKFQDHSFNGSHGSGHFKGDSIFISSQPGLAPYWIRYEGIRTANN